jgi:molybdopterin synthase catalytic subunit
LFAVNQEYASRETALKDKDELAIFPPVSGGDDVESNDFFEITDIGSRCRQDRSTRSAPAVWRECDARWVCARVEPLVDALAISFMKLMNRWRLSEMKRLGADAHRQFQIAHVGIVHRTGRLEIGETSRGDYGQCATS